MSDMLTLESRHALSRATFFLEKAKACSADARVDFESYLEAVIVFSRAAIHRLKTKHEHHPDWRSWWDSLRGDPSVDFFRTERDWILKEAPPKIGQKVYVPSIGSDRPSYVPVHAREFYYFEGPDVPATDTVEKHLKTLEKLLAEAERRF
jgi:hypothetical protein